jgi:hypothetical protein
MTSRDNAIVSPHGKPDKEVRRSVKTRNPPRDLRLPSQEFYSPHLNKRRQKEKRKWLWKRWKIHAESSDILNESYFPYLFVAVLL